MSEKTYNDWFNAKLNKFGEWEWTVNDAGEKVDAKLMNPEDFGEVEVKQTIDFFSKIDVEMLKEGNVQKLYNAGYNTIISIVQAPREELVDVLGENGNKVYSSLRKKLTNIPLYLIMGAFSKVRGIGVRKMKKLQKALGRDEMYKCNDADVIASIEGFDTKTAEYTVVVISKFIDFFHDVQDFVTIAEEETTGSSLSGEKVCMTGFRDKDMAAKIESLGGDVQSGVNGKTTILVAKDPNSTSGKIKKARDAGVKIMGIDEFKEFISM